MSDQKIVMRADPAIAAVNTRPICVGSMPTRSRYTPSTTARYPYANVRRIRVTRSFLPSRLSQLSTGRLHIADRRRESVLRQIRAGAVPERGDLRDRCGGATDLRERPNGAGRRVRVHRRLAEHAREQRLRVGGEQEVDERAAGFGVLRAFDERDDVRLDRRAQAAILLIEPRLADGVPFHEEHV